MPTKSSIETLEMVIENDQANPPFIGIVCHPHSQQGGTMNNKVVTTVSRVFRELGGTAIRFNFRGVGKSAGEYDHGIGETEDALAVIQWAHQKWPQANIWLAGFSFGAYVSLRAATQLISKKINLSQLISLAPAVNHVDFTGLHPHCPWMVVIAEEDELVPAADIKHWINKLDPQPEIVLFEETSHFFHGKLMDLRQKLTERLKHAHAL